MTGRAVADAARSALPRRHAASPPDGERATLVGARAGLASVSRRGGDGVAHVARLLDRALAELSRSATFTIDLEPRSGHRVSLRERAHFAARILSAQARRRVDWLVFSHLALARAQRTVPSRLRTPYAVFLHGVEAWGTTLDAGRLAALRDAALVLSNSYYTARRMGERHPELAPVVACPLGLMPPDDSRRAVPVDAELVGRVGAQSVLVVGRMSSGERYKGHDELLDSWPAVRSRVPDAQLVIVGHGDDAPRLQEKARSLGVSDRVLFTGRVSDATLGALYERTTLFAMPSRGEGFGIVYLEAMRAARPCIASAQDGAADVVVDGETGVLVPHHDVAALAAAISALLADPARAAALGRGGRARYEQHFTYERFRDRLAAALAPVFGARVEGTA